MFKKLSVRVSLALIIVLGVIISIFTMYLVNDRSEQMRKMILNKAIAAAQTGGKIMSVTFDNIVDNEVFTEKEMFDYTLEEIPFSDAIKKSYGNISDEEVAKLRQFHYKTRLDVYLDNLILPIEDEFFKDPQVIFAVVCDHQGYTPTHNSIYNHPIIGDYKTDLEKSRSKKVYYDSAIAKNSEEPYLFQTYNRDTGEEVWRISSPIFVKGKHWGSFRIGYSMQKTAEAVASLRNKLIFMMSLMMLLSVIVIYRVTVVMMRPLKALHTGVDRVAKGDLSFQHNINSNDEVGDLATAFNQMTSSLTHYIQELKETTATKERIQSELKVGNEIQNSMLPHIFPAYPTRTEFDIYATMEAAKEVAGDFYDFFFIDRDTFCFVIGDVSGKGVPSALFMVITKTLIQTEAAKGIPIDQVMRNVNIMLCHNNEANMFATVSLGTVNFNTGQVLIANAGHVPPLHRRANGSFNYVTIPANIALGLMDDFTYKLLEYQLQPSDTLFLYTDGITEAMNPQKVEFSEERLLKVFAKMQENDAEDIVKDVRAEIDKFAEGANQSDDITMMALTYFGPQEDYSAAQEPMDL